LKKSIVQYNNNNHTIIITKMSSEKLNSNHIRRLMPDDYNSNYIDLLGQLTHVGSISPNRFKQQFTVLPHIYIIEMSSDTGRRIIGSGTLLIEPKIIHECGSVGHIEDIVIDEEHRGQGLGQIMVNHLIAQAKTIGCYKVILNCEESNVLFYEKCGLQRKEIEMVKYFS